MTNMQMTRKEEKESSKEKVLLTCAICGNSYYISTTVVEIYSKKPFICSLDCAVFQVLNSYKEYDA